jgi:hypothetical protein
MRKQRQSKRPDKILAKGDNQNDHAFATGRRFRVQIAAALLIQIVALQVVADHQSGKY